MTTHSLYRTRAVSPWRSDNKLKEKKRDEVHIDVTEHTNRRWQVHTACYSSKLLLTSRVPYLQLQYTVLILDCLDAKVDSVCRGWKWTITFWWSELVNEEYPMVPIKDGRKESSVNRINRQVFPTPSKIVRREWMSDFPSRKTFTNNKSMMIEGQKKNVPLSPMMSSFMT